MCIHLIKDNRLLSSYTFIVSQEVAKIIKLPQYIVFISLLLCFSLIAKVKITELLA